VILRIGVLASKRMSDIAKDCNASYGAKSKVSIGSKDTNTQIFTINQLFHRRLLHALSHVSPRAGNPWRAGMIKCVRKFATF
jgi:hypothetical protein